MKNVTHPKEQHHVTLDTSQLEILQPRKYLKQLVQYFLRHLETFSRVAETALLEAAGTQHRLICVPWLRLHEKHIVVNQQCNSLFSGINTLNRYLNVAFRRKKTIRLFLYQNGLFFQFCRVAYLLPSRKNSHAFNCNLTGRTDVFDKNLCIFRKLVDRARDNEKHFICCFSGSI